MTELQWLIKMLTQHKLPPSLKDLFIERIGEVETILSRPTGRLDRGNPIGIPIQAPSMQKIMDETPVSNPLLATKPIAQEVITYKGNGTSAKGPRKF